MNEPSWPRLERLAPREAERITSLAFVASQLGLLDARQRLDALIEGTLDWSLEAVEQARATERAFGSQPLAAVTLSLPEGPALVLADPWLVHIAVDRVLGGEGARALEVAPLTETEEGVFAFLVASMILGSGAQVVAAAKDARACAAWLDESRCDRWHWRVRAGEHAAFVTLWVSANVSVRSLRSLSRAVSHDLPSTLQLRIGLAMLSDAELETLGVGDVVLPDQLSVSATSEGALIGSVAWCDFSGSTFLHTKRASSESAWVVEPVGDAGRKRVQSATVEDARERTTMENPSDRSALLRGLPVELALTLGQITLTSAEAARMVPGSLVKTGIPTGSQVQLVAGGRLIAVGELVDIEGELGVRILKVG